MRHLNQTFDAHLTKIASQVEGPIGVAISGGGDSIATLILTVNWAKRRQRDVFGLTVDHGLRAEAAREAKRVSTMCAQMGLAHDTLIWRPEPGHVAQAKSRRARHALLADAARARGCGLVLMGHTYDDQLETIAMRRARLAETDIENGGAAGLAGMRSLAVSPVWPNGRGVLIGRPALSLRREDLRGYLKDQSVSWIDDPSNEDMKYERVRVRGTLKGISEQGEGELEAQFSAASRTRNTHDVLIADWMSMHVRAGHDGLIEADTADLLSAEPLSEALAWLLMAAGGTDRRARKEARDELAADILAAPRKFRGRTLGGAQIAPRQGYIHIARDPGLVPVFPKDFKSGDIWDGRFRMVQKPVASSEGGVAQNLHEFETEADDIPVVSVLARGSYPFVTDLGFCVECVVPERLLMVEKVLRYGNM